MQGVDTSALIFSGHRQSPSSLVIIGAGTGGPQALAGILPRFPSTFKGSIIVVQQMRSGFTRVLANQLNDLCSIPVYEPTNNQELLPSEILIVPGGTRFTLHQSEESSTCSIKIDDVHDDPESLQNRTNWIMASASSLVGRDTIGVLLTGLGEDGRDGMRSISDAGGTTIAQDEDSCAIFDLPASAIDANTVHHVLPLWNIADHIISIATEGINANAA